MKMADIRKLSTRGAVSDQIQIIFAKHRVSPSPGEEGFWDGVAEVSKLNYSDGMTLYRLGKRWDKLSA